MFTFKLTGGKGQYTELQKVDSLKELEAGEFYFCVLKQYGSDGEESIDVDFVSVETMDAKVAGKIVKDLKVVRFLKGRSFLGVEAKQHTCRLDQLPACTFYGPMKVEVTAVEVGDVLKEIE